MKGGYNPMETDRRNILAFGRSHKGGREQYVTAANYSGERTTFAILSAKQGMAQVALTSSEGLMHEMTRDIRLDGEYTTLEPNQAVLFRSI